MEPIYQIRLFKKWHIDAIMVETEARKAIYEAGAEKVEEIAKKISAKMQQVIGINVPVKIVPPDSIERSIGKAKRVIDQR